MKTVAIVGLGALGMLFGQQLAQHMPKENVRIIADRARIDRYQRDGMYCNGERCDFHFVTPQTQTTPADLVLVAVKAPQLDAALSAIRNQVGEHTIILSLLNGITSEGIIAERYGKDKVLYCVAYGMDAVRDGNRLTYQNMGKLGIGCKADDPMPDQVQRVADFFESVSLPYTVDEHMEKRIWGKFMLNVGVNQTIAVFGPDYHAIQVEGFQRDTMIAAMREVIALSMLEGVYLTDEDLAYWLHLLATLNPSGKPSMRQDVEAKRPSEVSLFAGTILALAKKHGIATPINQMLFDRITAIEAIY